MKKKKAEKINRDKEKVQSQGNARATLQNRKNEKPKRDYLIAAKMWVSYLLAMLEKDRGKIPDNIGNRMLITNNVYITKSYISSVIQITELGLETPVTLIQEITRVLREEGSNAIVDFKIKNSEYPVKLKDSGLLSRINLWEKSMEQDSISDKQKEVAARCLYTVDIARSRKPLFKSRMYLTVRAKRGSELQSAEKIIYSYLRSIGAVYLPITANLDKTLKYISIISDHKDVSIKDVKAIVNSEQTLSQYMPNTGAFNGKENMYLGVDINNASTFNINFENITIARNIYVVAPSGVGKTVLALNLCCSAVERPNWAVCIQDIKGNEFTNFVQGTGGYVVSLRQNASGYINSWKMHKDDTNDVDAESYFVARIDFSKRQMMILSGISNPEWLNDLEELLDEFLDGLYVSMGVLPSNRNTWEATERLNPFSIYDALVEYMTPVIQNKYSTVSKTVLTSLRMYMSRNGSKSYLFKQEFDYAAILSSKTLMFDFGIMEGQNSNVDSIIFRLKFAYMRKLNGEFVSYKYSKGIKVLKILEESQIAVNDPEIMKGYVEEYTLRRAAGQTTLLLGNSITALEDNVISKPLIENTKALFIGELAPGARDTVVSLFGLQEQEEMLKSIGSDEKHDNTFLFINKMQSNSLTPLIKVILKPNKKYKLLTPVAQKNDMAR